MVVEKEVKETGEFEVGEGRGGEVENVREVEESKRNGGRERRGGGNERRD